MQSPPSAAGQARGAPALLLRLSTILHSISTVALYLAGAGLVIMTAIVAWQVFTRYVLNWSNAWTEPAAVMLMSWFIFLGAAVGVRENYHLGFDVLLYVLPKGSKRVLRSISDVLVFVFAAAMVFYGLQLVALTWSARLPSLGLPGGFNYLPLVVGGVLIGLFALERLALRWSGVEVDRDLIGEEIPTVDAVKEI